MGAAVLTGSYRSSSDLVDVVVVGGGPAGAAAAAAARADGLRVELVCAHSGPRPVPGESLPPGTASLLQEIFGATALDGDWHRASFGNRSVWGAAELTETEFIGNPFGHGLHIDRGRLAQTLLARLRAADVRVRADARITGPRWVGDRWQIGLAGHGQPELQARAMIDATGRAAHVARSQGARRLRLDHLIAAHWTLSSPENGGEEGDHNSATLVEAVADGWWYTTPVPRHRRVVAFLTDADLLPNRAARTTHDWDRRLAAAPNVRAELSTGRWRLHERPSILDAGVAHLDQPAGRGWVAVGDAAVSFDPLSSQGILTALLMGRAAGSAVAAILSSGDQQPLVKWGAEYARLLENHLRLRASCYALEQRWPTAPFWTRRQAHRAAA